MDWRTINDCLIVAFGAGCIIYGTLTFIVNIFDEEEKKK